MLSVICEKAVLLQCPCSGGPGMNPLVLLAIVAGIWLLASWTRSVLRKEGVSKMNKIGKVAIVVVLIAAVAAVIAVKYNKSSQETGAAVDVSSGGKVTGQEAGTKNQPAQLVGKGLPALIDIGAGTCIPCKMMAPILEELKTEFAGRMQVEFLDIREDSNLIQAYALRVIPTQIFYDASGKELFRHEGFFSKEDILGKWKYLGINLGDFGGSSQ